MAKELFRFFIRDRKLVVAEECHLQRAHRQCSGPWRRMLGAETGESNSTQPPGPPSPSSEPVPVQSFAMDADDYADPWYYGHDRKRADMPTDHTAGAPASLSPFKFDSEGEQSRQPPNASSEFAPQTDEFNCNELDWALFVIGYVAKRLGQRRSVEDPNVWKNRLYNIAAQEL